MTYNFIFCHTTLEENFKKNGCSNIKLKNVFHFQKLLHNLDVCGGL